MGEQELSFESAAELFEALVNPNAMERRPVLQWVANHPDEAIAFGALDGRDVVDVLIGLVDMGVEYRFWEDLAMTIGVFDAPRATEFFAEMLARAQNAIAAQDAASALGRRQRSAVRERLVEIVLDDEAPDRPAAAAELLIGDQDLPERAAVRVATLEGDRKPPPLDETVADAWLEELAGPFGEQARDRLEAQGADAVRAIGARWERLGEEDRGWLLDWAAEAAPGEAERLIGRALESGPNALALSALQAASRLPAGSVDPGLLGPWGQHADPELRAAAIAAGAASDPEFLLADSDADPELVVAAIRRLAERDGARAFDAIAARLSSDSLEVRAAAREEIVAIGPDAVEPLRPLVHSEDPETRAGAVRALLDLGDDEWLAEELL